MSEKKKPDQDLPEWLPEYKMKDILASAEVNIKPKLEIDALGIEHAKEVEIASLPYIVEIPKDKAITENTKLWMIDLIYQETVHQFTAQGGSFRFQLGVLKERLKLKNWNDIIGLKIKLWKESKMLDTPKFKGKATVYCIAPNF